MSGALAHVSHLKPKIHLAKAVSDFEANLKSQYISSSPDPRDVMRLTTGIDRCAFQEVGSRRGNGPRLTNFLQDVQQFAALGDITTVVLKT